MRCWQRERQAHDTDSACLTLSMCRERALRGPETPPRATSSSSSSFLITAGKLNSGIVTDRKGLRVSETRVRVDFGDTQTHAPHHHYHLHLLFVFAITTFTSTS